MNNKRLDNVNLLKTIAILMVVAIHIPLFDYFYLDTHSTSKMIQYCLRLLSEGVPIFLLVNGYLLFSKENIDLKKHYKKVLKLFILLFVWGIIYILFAKRQEGVLQYLTVKDILVTLFETKAGSDYTSHFWFIEALIAIYLVYPLLWSSYKNNYKIFGYIFVVLAAFTVGIDCLQLIRDFATCLGWDCLVLNNFIWFTNSIRLISDSWHLFYFMLGGIMLHNIKYIKNKKVMFSLVGLVGILLSSFFATSISSISNSIYDVTFNYGSIFMVMFVVGLFAVTEGYKNNGNIICKMISTISKDTFGIYLLNRLIISIIESYNHIDILFNKSIMFVLVIVASCLLTELIKRIPVAKYFITL